MLFKDLNPNYPIFIFNKTDITVQEGKVINKGLPHFDMLHNTTSAMVTDITIKAGDVTKTYTFKDDTEIGYAENLVISPNRDAILREVESIKDQSEQVLNQIDLHKATIENVTKYCPSLIRCLKRRKKQNNVSQNLNLLLKILKQ